MSRLRVAYLIDSLGAGGSERSLVEMLPYLAAAGVEPRIYVLSEAEHDFSGLAREQGLRVERLPAAGWLRRRSHLRRALQGWPADLLHTTLFYSDVLGRLAAWRSGVPVISSLVSVGYEPERLADPRVRPWRLRAVRFLDSVTGRHLTSRFHAVSEAAKESAIRQLGLSADSITVVRRGRDVAHYSLPDPERRAACRRRWHVGDDEILVANVGRQAYHKAQGLLLEAVLGLVRSGLPLRVVVAGGEGPSSEDLRRFVAQHELTDRVTLAGHVDDVPGLLAAADLFAFPSRLEGFPGAVLEAIAMGLPVVAADIPAVREIFPDPGDALLVPRDSAGDLAASIERLASDASLRRRLGGRSREIFLERFDIRKSVTDLVALYRRVAGNGDRG